MSASPSILILGAAGYIGGTVLTELLKTQSPTSITALVRTPAQASLLSPLGINTSIGTLEDLDLLKSLVTASDVVMNFAVPFGGGDASIQALVDGLEERAEKGGDLKPVLIQTSGSGTVLYGAGGIAGDDVWTDEDYERWNALPNEAYFHTGNKIVAAAALRGKISAYILMSPTVYGKGTGPGTFSLQLPAYVRYAKRTGGAAYIGEGNNIWGNVHVQDLASLYTLVMNHALANPSSTKASDASKGWENLIYAGLAQHTWGPAIKTLGDLMYARGEVKTPSAVSIPDSEGDMFMFGGNSFLAVSKKAKALGFVQREKDLIESMKEALPAPSASA